MRMPIFSYFLAGGSVLTALLLWLGNENGSNGRIISTSQVIGLPKPFKALPEEPQYKLTGINFGADYNGSEKKAAKRVETAPKAKAAIRYSARQIWNHLAEYPHDNLSIH